MKKQTTLNAPPHAPDASISQRGDKHLAAWDRAKEALRRDWEQTLSDLSSGGASLNQSAADTVKQATGAAPVPARQAKTHPDASADVARQRGRIADLRREWGQVEPAVRYGYGARLEHDDDVWDERVEGRLMIGWEEMHAGGVWEEARPFVRHGWDAVRTEGPL